MPYEPSQLESILAGDVTEVLLSDFGFEATYKKGGADPGGPVTLYLGPAGQENRKAGVGRFAADAAAARGEKRRMIVKAAPHGELIPDSLIGLSVSGGVAELAVGDVFVVPVRKLGETGTGTADVVVTGGIGMVEGHWNAEVAR